MKNLPKILSLGLTATALTLLSSPQASAQTKTWDGGGANDNWQNGDNWDLNTVPVAGNTLIFAGSTRTSAVNDFAANTVFNLRFDAAASPFTLSGATIALGAANITAAAGSNLNSSSLNTQTISANLDLSAGGAGGRTINVVTGGNLLISGNISGTAGLIKTGSAGTLILTGNNTFTGNAFAVDTGTLQVSSIGNANATSAAGGTNRITLGANFSTATLTLADSSAAQSTDKQINVGNNSADRDGGAIIRNDNANAAHSLTFTASTFNVSAGALVNMTRTVTLGGINAGNNTIVGAIVNNPSAAIAVTKADAGKWILGGASTYSGGTTINAGTLLVNNVSGSGTGTAAVTLNAATLGGTGTISGLVTTNGTTSVISPGNSPGTLNLTGGLNAAAGATFTFELGTTSDSLNLGSGVFTGSTAAGGLLFDFSNSGGLAFSTPYTLITFGSSPSLDYTDLVANTLPSGVTLDTSFGTGGWRINSGSLQVQLIPEPSSALLLLAGLGALALRRRYQKA